MSRKELLLKNWEFTYEQEDWYPPLRDALSGVTAAQASWRPVGEAANTIWENVSHLLYYKERLLHRLLGTEFPLSAESNDDTFVPSGGPDDEDAWKQAQQRMESVHRQIQEKLASLSEEAFDQGLPTTSIAQSVMSIMLHDACHTGQIVQIRKLQGSWPAKRHFT
ncbi:DinB family protein [Brevibacillus choshinensis]|uniref:DinB family protein n=1 Tax=Brevibacillus choshinensis TaxID=54911 RepID=A0ABX7FRG2_BRECH|nr:DinB family protein [Brevibacillus choshinensis]QRG68696.1 DinB family protein [Brevibacillus choshinensis]